MKKYVTIFTAVLLVSSLGLLSPVAAQWFPYTIDDDLNNGTILDIGDLDGDGDMDLALSDWVRGAVYWYENDYPSWQRHDIAMLQGAVGCVIADMDNDDTLDVVAAGFSARAVVWYENNLPGWTTHIIDDKIDGEDAKVGDMDGDLDLDVVITATESGKVIWYENINLTWTKHIIDSDLVGAYSLELFDMNADDTLDVVATGRFSNTVACYENHHPIWSKYTIDENLPGALDVYTADLDGNGTQDVIATGDDVNSVFWYDNNHPTWTRYPIDENLPGAAGIYAADIGGDERLDVLAAGPGSADIVWYENNLPEWTTHTIDDNSSACGGLISTDLDMDGNVDVFAVGRRNLVFYHHKPDVAHTKSMKNWCPRFIPQTGDSIITNAQIYNPENHQVSVYAVVKGVNYTYTDSIPLYDDGEHHDGLASDNIWGNREWLSGLSEDTYTIEIATYDTEENYPYNFPASISFTTIGPLELIDYEITSPDTIPNQGDLLNFKLRLKNSGQTAVAPDITSSLIALDSCVTISGFPNRPYGDIGPGETVTHIGNHIIDFSDIGTVDSMTIKVLVEISSNYDIFWYDTLKIFVTDVTDIDEVKLGLPRSFALYQNHPNPFNPSTIINYELPISNEVELSIYNLLGQKVAILVLEKQNAGFHQVEWDASGFSSGVYYYMIKSGEFVDVKKMVLLR